VKLYNLNKFKLGWILGDFLPSIIRTSEYEVAIKKYKKGYYEKMHFHKKAIEITVIVKGIVIMNSKKYTADDIILIEKGEKTDFKVLEDTITTVIKMPSVIKDKFIV